MSTSFCKPSFISMLKFLQKQAKNQNHTSHFIHNVARMKTHHNIARISMLFKSHEHIKIFVQLGVNIYLQIFKNGRV